MTAVPGTHLPEPPTVGEAWWDLPGGRFVYWRGRVTDLELIRETVAAMYKNTALRRLGNALITPLARLGPPGKRTHILTLPGRRTGRRHSTPVQLVIDGESRWLVAPYGERDWVKNARAAGQVALTRAGKARRRRIEEVAPEEGSPVLREYLRTTPIVKPYFDADVDAPLETFAAEAAQHPVFRLVDQSKAP